jgi:methionyl-tRNA formyltransferase
MTKRTTTKSNARLASTGEGESRRVRFAFFGTPELAVTVLEELAAAGLVPALIVTMPDEKKGRGLSLSPPPVKTWAESRDIEALQPEHVDPEFVATLKAKSRKLKADVFIVVAYGKILNKEVLEIPSRGVLNVHPSLLPRLRGPSPIRSAILNDDRATGVSIILLDEEMDHGPLVAQKPVAIGWPARAGELERALMEAGGTLLAQILPQWVMGNIEAREQNHDLATYSEKIEKEDGLLDLNADGYTNLLKIRAYEGWPGTYAFFERGGKRIRVQILDAHMDPSTTLGASKLIIDKVKPEGKREMGYEEFLRSGASPL